ncbi:hypothetical protein [Streptomyces sp. NPDC006012]|uniref:hypothetical protein n=1 Tax=Streptomyces sp. NPDC006012 TaxID=3364739 RepID=UPI0036C29887
MPKKYKKHSTQDVTDFLKRFLEQWKLDTRKSLSSFSKAADLPSGLGHRWAKGEVRPSGRDGLSETEKKELIAYLDAEGISSPSEAVRVTQFFREFLKTEDGTSLRRFCLDKGVNMSTAYTWAHGKAVEAGRAGLSKKEQAELAERLRKNRPSEKKKQKAPGPKDAPAPLFGPHASASVFDPQGQAGDTGFSPSTFPPAPHLPLADSSLFGENMRELPNPVAPYANYYSNPPGPLTPDVSHVGADLTNHPAAQYANYDPNLPEQPAADASRFGPDSRTLPAPRASGGVRSSDYFLQQARHSRAGSRGGRK